MNFEQWNNKPEQLSFDFESVEPHIVRESRDQINLELGEFAGPLDLLLYLIKQEKANIFDIPIAQDHGRIFELYSSDEKYGHFARGGFYCDGGDFDRDKIENAFAARSDFGRRRRI